MLFAFVVMPMILAPVRFGTLLWVSRMEVKSVALWMPKAFSVPVTWVRFPLRRQS
ncbi:hypothetical protein BH20ACI3_BH20ACI3_09200 [soil metagenome]